MDKPRRRIGRRRLGLGPERGAVGAEAVLAMLVIVPLLVAMIVFAQTLDAWQAQNHVAAAAARQVAQEGGDSAALRGRVAADLATAGLDPASVSIVIEPAAVDWREPVTVELRSTQRVRIPFLLEMDVPLRSRFTTRGEVNR
ncbi:MAG: hypothetical protein OXG64_04165 [Chloroflexi bacterium]|nr:hypothetical protein [Chloroflexota bacterium]